MSTPAKGPGDGLARRASHGSGDPPAPPEETCDLCGSTSVEWRSCKLICRSCRAIVRSCADL